MNMNEIANCPNEFFNSFQEYRNIYCHSKLMRPQFFFATSIHLESAMELDLLLRKIMLKVIEAIILNGKSKGGDVLISCLPVIPTDTAFEFKRLQFHVRLTFRGRSWPVMGIPLPYFPDYKKSTRSVASSVPTES